MSVVYEDVKRFCDEISKTNQNNILSTLFSQFDAPQPQILTLFNQWRSESKNTVTGTSQLSTNLIAQINHEINQAVTNAVTAQQKQINQGQQVEQHLLTTICNLEEKLTLANDELSAHSEQVNQLEQDYQAEHNQLVKEHQKAIEALNHAHQATLTQQVEEHQHTIDTLSSDHKQSLASLSQQLIAQKQDAESQQAVAIKQATNELNQMLADLKVRLHNEVERLTDEKSILISSHQNELKQLAKNNQHELAQLEAKHQLIIQELSLEHQHQLTNAVPNNDAIIDKLHHKINDSTTKITRLESQLLEANKASESLNNQLSQLQEQLHQQGTKHQHADQSIEQLQRSVFESEEKIKQAEQQALKLQQENTTLVNQVDFVKNNSIATVERLTAKSDQAVQKVRELEHLLTLEKNSGQDAKQERNKLKEQLAFMKHNQTTTFERLTNSAAKANTRVKELEQRISELEGQ